MNDIGCMLKQRQSQLTLTLEIISGWSRIRILEDLSVKCPSFKIETECESCEIFQFIHRDISSNIDGLVVISRTMLRICQHVSVYVEAIWWVLYLLSSANTWLACYIKHLVCTKGSIQRAIQRTLQVYFLNNGWS